MNLSHELDSIQAAASHSGSEQLSAQLAEDVLSPKISPYLPALTTSNLVVISGFPTSDQPTPERYVPKEAAILDAHDILLLGVMGCFGIVVSVDRVRGGRIINDVMPRAGFEDRIDSAFGSRKEFDAHVDVAWAKPQHRSDLFGLLCQKNRSRTPTKFYDIDITELELDTLEALRSPLYRVYFDTPGDPSDPGIYPTPLIEQTESGNEKLNYYGAAKTLPADPDDQVAVKALEKLNQLISDSLIVEVDLSPGDLVVAPNIPHGRPIIPSYDTTGSNRRWLQRVYVVSEPSKIESVRRSGSRIFSTQ